MKGYIKKGLLIVFAIIVIAGVISIITRELGKNKGDEEMLDNKVSDNYNINIIKATNIESKNTNYLISPYNIEIALNMLREGASGKTKEEIDKVIGNRKINDVSIKDKVSIANALFIKNDYENDVKKDFINILDSKYRAELLYDEFKTPEVINKWVNTKTNGMIDKLLDRMNSDFVLGLASALAIDVEWENAFECNRTTSEEFTKEDNSKLNVQMMHKEYSYNANYFKTSDAIGIILPYQESDNTNLEFVGILPNSNVNDYISNLTNDKLNNIFKNTKEASDKLHINLSLPRFTYGYEVPNFIKILNKLGIKEAFDSNKANFKKMIVIDENVYVGEAIHKTKIELNETGTKAAAVTAFMMFKNAAILDKNYEEINIKFNKPFVYMIREHNTGEILFFGTVFEPNIWNGNTCTN